MTEQLPEPVIFQRLEIALADAPAEEALLCRLEPGEPNEQKCSPFSLPLPEESVSHVSFRHVIQHFRRAEAVRFLRECWRVLTPGGEVYLIAPNLDYYLEKYRAGARALAFAGLWGEQETAAQTHHWGYDREALCALLGEAGFIAVEDLTGRADSLEKHERHLEFRARKHAPRTTGATEGRIAGGRQIATKIDDVRSDHVERYHFAAQFVRPGDLVLDLACGIGYGTYLLATETQCARVTGIDIDPEAVRLAKERFSHDKVTFLLGNVLDASLPVEPADCITAFEVLEHIARDLEFLSRIRSLLKPGGRLIISSPNEELIPYSPQTSPYHVRHHTPAQLRDELQRAGFRILAEASQDAFQVLPGFGRRFNIAVCQRDDRLPLEQFQMPRVDSSNPEAADPRDRTIGLLLSACRSYSARLRALEAERSKLHDELEAHAEALRQLRSNPLVRIAAALRRVFKPAK